MKVTRRKFLKWLATVLAAWGIAPAAFAKSADNGPGLAPLPPLDGQKGVTIGTRIIYGGPVRFNSKDFGVVVFKSNPNINWKKAQRSAKGREIKPRSWS